MYAVDFLFELVVGVVWITWPHYFSSGHYSVYYFYTMKVEVIKY